MCVHPHIFYKLRKQTTTLFAPINLGLSMLIEPSCFVRPQFEIYQITTRFLALLQQVMTDKRGTALLGRVVSLNGHILHIVKDCAQEDDCHILRDKIFT